MLPTAVLLAILPLLSTAVAQNCPLSFDGRIPANFSLTDLDSNITSPYDPTFVLGQGLKWSQVDLFPDSTLNSTSLFDKAGTKAFEVTISDKSIFASSPTSRQIGFRRAEHLAAKLNSTFSTTGVKTFHFSLKADPSRPVNFSHEYQLVFQEDAAFSTNQFALKTGTLLGTTPANASASASMQLIVQGNQNKSPVDTLFTTPFDQTAIHNFGIVEDFDTNTTQILYSTNKSPLTAVTQVLPNVVSGNGQFHFGLLKKPTGNNLTDVTTQGFQESGINEGIIFGGVFQEDSAGGCISLS